MNNRTTNHFPDIAGVITGPGVHGWGGVTYLVVDDDVDAAACGEMGQVGETESFCYDALYWGFSVFDKKKMSKQPHGTVFFFQISYLSTKSGVPVHLNAQDSIA